MNEVISASLPYQKAPDGRIFPIIALKIQHQEETIEISALIDSGATTSIFRPEVAKKLGLKIENGKEIALHGVGGWIKGYLHKLDVGIAGKKFKCPIIFSHEYTVSLNLLGREGFFKKFVVTFDEKRKEVRLE